MVRARAVFSNRSTSNKAPQVCFHTCLTYDETNVDFTVCLKRARCPCNKRSIPSDIQNKNNNNKKNMVNSTFQAIALRKRLQNISSVIKSRSLYRTVPPLFTGFHSVHAASSNKSTLLLFLCIFPTLFCSRFLFLKVNNTYLPFHHFAHN